MTQAWTPASDQCTTDPATANLGGAAPYWHSYSRDTVGNRTQVVENALPNGTAAQTQTYTRPASGPNSVRPHAVTSVSATGRGAGTSSYAWDAAGNLTGRNVAGQATQQLAWDVEGELAELRQDGNGDGDTTDAKERDSYVNTADGERVLRTQDGTTTLYLGYQELTLNHASGAISGERYYSFAGQTIATRTGYFFADVTTIIGDHHNTGSVQIPNVAGPSSRVHRYTDPFGKPRGPHTGQGADGGADGNWTGEHGYLDKPVDSTGLTAIGARMYDPGLGAFVSVDPVMDLADPQQWNAYGYSNNNPTTFADPTGERYEECGTTHSCTYGKGGNVTSAKKYKKRKPTINDLRSQWRTNYGTGSFAGRSVAGGSSFGAPTVDWEALAERNRQLAQIRARDAAHAKLEREAQIAHASAALRYHLTTAQGIERWTGVGADWAGYLSLGALGLQGVALFLAAATSWTGIGGIGFGAMAIGLRAGSSALGTVSTGLSFANGFANTRLGRHGDAGRSYASGVVGAVTGGLGAGAARISLKVGMETSPYVGELMLGLGGWVAGSVVGSDGAKP